MSESSSPLGRLSQQRFQIHRLIGEGSCGIVYEAFDQERGEPVALKALLRLDAESLSRLKQEFRSLADLSHRNLVRLHELLFDGQQFFFTMELVQGTGFVQHVRQESAASAAGGPDLQRLNPALEQLAEGLCALHQARKLHRDIKPSNVLVTHQGRLVLLDFDLLTGIPPERAQPPRTVGTPRYVSPEQAAGKKVSEATDWYAVGVMLFEALTGQLPFMGSPMDVVPDKQQLPPPFAETLAGLPQDLVSLCVDLLHREPERRPTGPEVLRRLRQAQQVAARDVEPEPPVLPRIFIGRVSQLDALKQAFQTAHGGQPVIVHLHGTAGMGKSALAAHFLDWVRARDREAVVLQGRCHQQEAAPYKGLDGLVDALIQHLASRPAQEVMTLVPRNIMALARLFPVLRQVEAVTAASHLILEISSSQDLRREAALALRRLFARLARRRPPLVLLIDDLHLGDADSAILLGELFQGSEPPPVLLVACYNTEGAATSEFLKTWREAQGGRGSLLEREVYVGPLGGSEAQRLAQNLLGGNVSGQVTDPEGIASTLVAESRGSPQLIEELVRHTLSSGGAGGGGGRDDAVQGDGRDGTAEAATVRELDGLDVERAIMVRIQRLPDLARRLLEVLAVFGAPLRLDVLQAAARTEAVAQKTLFSLRQAQLARLRGGGEVDELEIFNDCVARVVLASLSPQRLRSHHRCLALALETHEAADAETLAIHFMEADDFERAAEHAVRAADQALGALAYDRAARLYRMALDLPPACTLDSGTLLWKLGDALVGTDRGPEAARAYLDASRETEGLSALRLRQRAAEELLKGGRIEQGLQALAGVLEAVGLEIPKTPARAFAILGALRARLRIRGLAFERRRADEISDEELLRLDACWSATTGLVMVNPVYAGYFQTQGLLLALKAGEPGRVGRGLISEALHHIMRGRKGERVEQILEMARVLARELDDPWLLAHIIQLEGLAALNAGQWRRSRELMQQARHQLTERCVGTSYDVATINSLCFFSLLWQGQWRELARQIQPLLDAAQAAGDRYAESHYRFFACWMQLAADKPERVQEEAALALQDWPEKEFFYQHWTFSWITIESLLYADQGDSAWRQLNGQWPSLKRSKILGVRTIEHRSIWLRTRCALAAISQTPANGRGPLLRVSERGVSRLQRISGTWARGNSILLQACLQAIKGDREGAAYHLRSAREIFREADMALLEAVCGYRLGQLEGGAVGRDLMAQAGDWMAQQDIRRADRLCALFAPGPFGPEDQASDADE